MSLLLDALKRAEQEKQAHPEEAASAAPSGGRGKPTLELQPAPPPQATPGASTRSPSQAAAQAVAPAPASSKRRVLWIAGALIVAVIAIAVGYVWYSIAQLQPKPIARTPALRPVPQPAPAAEAVAPTAPLAATPAVAATSPAPVPAAAAPAIRAPALSPEGPARPAAAPREASAAVLQPTRAAERPRVPAEVAAGYDALRRGDLAAARRSYGAAIAADPANLDAVLGLATLEARGGNRTAAARHYRRALDLDPRNPTALAGMAALVEFARPEALESQLLRDIAEQPASASLHAMLGNLYAGQARWTQAQAAFFEAHRLDPANADVAHNLAVSLDHLGQPRVAAAFYRKALESAREQPGAFDTAAVERRLAEIETVR